MIGTELTTCVTTDSKCNQIAIIIIIIHTTKNRQRCTIIFPTVIRNILSIYSRNQYIITTQVLLLDIRPFPIRATHFHTQCSTYGMFLYRLIVREVILP